jgi:uncharacterized SAM-binding protein YcdF (DUF218 family)
MGGLRPRPRKCRLAKIWLFAPHMFFVASKLFWIAAEPVTFLLLAGVLGVFLGFTRFAGAARVLTAGAILLLAAGLLTPVGALILRPLENQFPQPPEDMPEPSGIIVLGGAVDAARSQARGQVVLNSDAARMTKAVELARRYPEARLVYTGGAAELFGEGPAEAVAARDFWLSLGVPEKRITLEEKSLNTWENALFTRDLVRPKPGETWLLITSAWHMPRSVGIFRHIGFAVIPYPVAYRTFGDSRDLYSLASMGERVITLDTGIREWFGLLAYWLAGKSDGLFPSP